MEKMMKSYPYIGKSKHGNNYLFTSINAAYSLINKSWMPDASQLMPMENITHEYLQNTYGEVVSPEHAEFIVELAELNGFELARQSNHLGNFFSFDVKKFCFIDTEIIASQYCKKITIPLPPKAEPKIYPQEKLGELPKHFDYVCNKCGGKCCTGQCDKQESSEWPKVGSIVTWGNKSVKGEVKALSDGLAWIKNEYGNYCSEYVSSLQKPKTPAEELRDELVNCIHNHNEIWRDNNSDIGVSVYEFVGDALLKKYDIKKKPQ